MSVLNLYYSTTSNPWKLNPGKLFKLDDIAEYLANRNKLVINNFQYIKNALELSIKVDMSQANAQPLNSSGFKYVSIANTNDRVAYYYVKRVIWRSSNTVQFDLLMDVLNTLVEGTDYNFKANTKIIREHKDRFIAVGNYTATFTFQISEYEGTINVDDIVAFVDGEELFTGRVVFIDQYSITLADLSHSPEEIRQLLSLPGEYIIASTPDIYIMADVESIEFNYSGRKYYRNIDYVSENINPLLENKQSVKVINPKSLLEQDWYLLYRNQNDPSDSLVNPVECYLIPQKANLKVDSGAILGGRLIPSYLEDNKYYYFRVDSGQTYTLSNGQSISYTSNPRLYVVVTKVEDKINVLFVELLATTGGAVLTITGNYDVEYMTISSLPAYYAKLNGGNFDAGILMNLDYDNEFNNSSSYNVLDNIEKIDRTDAKNIKLIKLPYCPYDFQTQQDVLKISASSDWEYSSITQANGGVVYVLKLLNSNTKLVANFKPYLNPLTNLATNLPNTASINDLRKTNLSMESKLYHSDFYKETFVYDSFSWFMPLEKLNINSYKAEQNRMMNLKFNVTSTINSKFLFTFTPFVSSRSNENYPNVLPIARNNEEVLYNVPYINYVRTGYNYDVKAKNISEASNWIGVGLGAASIGASLLFPSVPLKVAGVVASVVSFASSVKSSITTTLQNEEGLKQKILQTQNQTSSVTGSNDVDLMSEYSGNRLTWMRYEPSDLMKNLLFDLFFYAGYTSGRMGLPNHNTRCNFDYLECEAELESEGANISDDIINELKNCLKVGVTYIHKTSRSTDKWDIEQKYENWEINLI